jgi:hypothetical protein
MKKHFLIAALLVLLVPVHKFYAQNFGVRAGMNFPTMLIKDDEETYTDNNRLRPGFHMGGVIDYALTDALSLEGDLLVSLKGIRTVEKDGDYKYSSWTNLYYINIPLLAKYTFDAGSVKLYGAAGPYFGIGITGKYRYKDEYDGETETDTEKIEWGNDPDNDDLKRFDAGLHLGAGILLGQIQAGLFYELGLANMAPDNSGGFRIKNRVFGVTAAYFFSK